MYYRKPQGWTRHIDFMLWDILCLQLAFVLAFMTRHGFMNPYETHFYRGTAIVYTLVDFFVLVSNNTMNDVLKRGYYEEIVQTVKHVCLSSMVFALYLFSVQESETYSRITFYLMAGYYAVISYAVRVWWKKRANGKKNIVFSKAIYFIVDEQCAESVIRHFQENSMGDYIIQGVCVWDRAQADGEILGIAVTSTGETVLKYL